MTDKERDEIIEIGAFLALLLLLFWVFGGLFGSGTLGQTTPETTTTTTTPGGPTITYNAPPFMYSPYFGGNTGTGSCGCDSCGVNTSAIATVNAIIASANLAASQIIAAGNATLEAQAQIENASDPLLNVVVG